MEGPMIRFGWLLVVGAVLLMTATPSLAQTSSASSALSEASPSVSSEAPAAAPAAAQVSDWQGVIDHQVQAFRDHDAAAALSDAAKSFKDAFPDPAAFFTAIMTGGYQPIMDSQSDTFGEYQIVAPDTVLQRVSFVGKDQMLYEAIYQLTHEDAGWRVVAVQLTKAEGTGV
jgi:hypothetical protein